MKLGSPHRTAVRAALSREWQTAQQIGAKCSKVAPRTVRAHLVGLTAEGLAETRMEWPAFLYRRAK